MEESQDLPLDGTLLGFWHAYRTSLALLIAVLAVCLRLTALRGRQITRKQPRVAVHEPNVSTKFEPKPAADPSRKLSSVQDLSIAKVQNGPKRIIGVRKKAGPSSIDGASRLEMIQPIIFYFSVGGSTQAWARKLALSFDSRRKQDDNDRVLPVKTYDLTQVDYDDYFTTTPKSTLGNVSHFYILLIPSYDIDTELLNLLSHMRETHYDFRIDTGALCSLAGYSVFGFGDKSGWPTEKDGFCSQAIEVDKWMARLTERKRAYPLGVGDVNSDAGASFENWTNGVIKIVCELTTGNGLGEGVPGSGDAVESDGEESISSSNEESGVATKSSRKRKVFSSMTDLEDTRPPIPIDFTKKNAQYRQVVEPKPMVPKSSPTYNALTKQGYTIVGTHSGVKICRWTKSALRGRGSCYKFSFYGIASHLCMEATPSLSCSNKCVFCWRHGTNPVGTTWRWTVDPPDMIFAGMKEGHYQKIKMMRGVPGVRAERFAEAMRIRHCALSLVGEPIFYPHINELLKMLHNEHISSFLVCNAQHPDQLASLGPVTQLYVSIDASNKESLKRIDRPLHRDFWERFIRCMDILREKRFTHRTVFRLTLVKGFNIEDEAEGYADLVARALPCFVEVKGVTYCGTSTAAGAGLSMQNVPFYDEVAAFVRALEQALRRRGLAYGIAAEHAHSCCVLLADEKRFFRPSVTDGIPRWHTLIDYAKFFECLASGDAFGPEDYIGAPTPEWALWGNGGFDPRDTRVDRKGKVKEAAAD